MKISFFLMTLLLTPMPGFGEVDVSKDQIFKRLTEPGGGPSLDSAVLGLNMVLKKVPTKNPKEACEAQVLGMVGLLSFEQNYPGYLAGSHGTSVWPQYKVMRELYEELRKIHKPILDPYRSRNQPQSGGQTDGNGVR